MCLEVVNTEQQTSNSAKNRGGGGNKRNAKDKCRSCVGFSRTHTRLSGIWCFSQTARDIGRARRHGVHDENQLGTFHTTSLRSASASFSSLLKALLVATVGCVPLAANEHSTYKHRPALRSYGPCSEVSPSGPNAEKADSRLARQLFHTAQ